MTTYLGIPKLDHDGGRLKILKFLHLKNKKKAKHSLHHFDSKLPTVHKQHVENFICQFKIDFVHNIWNQHHISA